MPLLLSLLFACGNAPPTETEAEPTAVEAPVPADPDAQPDEAPAAAAADNAEALPEKLNLNTTDEADFKALDGVGDKMAHEFVEYRPYVSIQQFRKEMSKYVDADKIAAFETLVYVPVDYNNCDAATLMQIPGLDESEAEALMNGRPYPSADAFQVDLKPMVDADALPVAAAYLSGS